MQIMSSVGNVNHSHITDVNSLKSQNLVVFEFRIIYLGPEQNAHAAIVNTILNLGGYQMHVPRGKTKRQALLPAHKKRKLPHDRAHRSWNPLASIYLDSASACFWMSCSAPRCWVLPVSCCFWYSAWAAVLPVMPATAPPTVPETRSAMPEPRSESWPLASCCWPSRFWLRPWDLRDCV